MNQPSLFDRPPAQSHSPTSLAAAEQIEPTAGTLRAAVLDFLKERGDEGATDQEIQAGLQMDANTERPRRVELVNAGKVKNSGMIRQTASKRGAIVWRAV